VTGRPRRAGPPATRARLLEAATGLFAAHGFRHVTIRDICRAAGANVAAVNYHFGGKMDLYADVLATAVGVLRAVTDEAAREAEGQPAEVRLAIYVRVHCERMFAPDGATWLRPLIQREMQDPTEGLTALLDGAFEPRFKYLAGIVAELLGDRASDECVIHCTASVHAQIVAFRPSAILDRLPPKARRAFAVERVTAHITAFSLAAIAAYRPPPPPARRARARATRL
jgi:AcrR family transcriptional regulator